MKDKFVSLEPLQPSLDRVYYYHGDHLGSSTYATDDIGRPVAYYDYLPFGEVAVEHNQTTNFNNGYKFNAKELDEATGMSYYGARYYDSRLSVFVSVDPLAEKYRNIGGYVYTANNPINFIDPDGRELVGVNKSSASKLHGDINKVFADKKFDAFRSLITRGKKNNNLKFDKISISDFDNAMNGIKGDDYDLARSVFEVINSSKEFSFEFIDNAQKPLSLKGTKVFEDYSTNTFGFNREAQPDYIFTGENIVAGGSEGMSIPTKNGSYSFIIDEKNTRHLEGRRELTSFHEIFGHGIPHANGISGDDNHNNAIRYENLVRRVIGIETMRDGTNPRHNRGEVVPNFNDRPIIHLNQ